jgi:hypothetical protein
MDTMRKHPTAAAVQAEGCHALRILAFDQYAGIADNILAEEGLQVIHAALSNHTEDPTVLGWACGAFKSLTYSSLANMIKVSESDAVPAILTAMRAHPTSELLQEHGSGALLNLLGPDADDEDETVKKTVSKTKATLNDPEHAGVAAILTAMRLHPKVPKLQRHGCIILFELTKDWSNQKENAEKLLETDLDVQQAKQAYDIAKPAGAAGLIATAIVTHPGEDGVQEHGPVRCTACATTNYHATRVLLCPIACCGYFLTPTLPHAMPTQSVLDKLEPLEEIPEVAIVDLAATVLEEARERWVAASDADAGVSGPNPTPAAL